MRQRDARLEIQCEVPQEEARTVLFLRGWAAAEVVHPRRVLELRVDVREGTAGRQRVKVEACVEHVPAIEGGARRRPEPEALLPQVGLPPADTGRKPLPGSQATEHELRPARAASVLDALSESPLGQRVGARDHRRLPFGPQARLVVTPGLLDLLGASGLCTYVTSTERQQGGDDDVSRERSHVRAFGAARACGEGFLLARSENEPA